MSVSPLTTYLAECNIVKLVKKILGENEFESALQRLDRLTLNEARTTAMQTLEIVQRLVQNMRVVIDGAATLSRLTSFVVDHPALQTERHRQTLFWMP